MVSSFFRGVFPEKGHIDAKKKGPSSPQRENGPYVMCYCIAIPGSSWGWAGVLNW